MKNTLKTPVKIAALMRLADRPFELIKSGVKTVEVRLNDEKRRKLEEGQTIVFARASGAGETISAKIAALHRFGSFSELFHSELFPACGFGDMTPEAATEAMYEYYSTADELFYGVLAIELKKL